VHFFDADLRAVVQALGHYLDRPVLFSNVPGNRVTLDTPHPVARADLLPLLRGLAESQNLELVRDSAYYRLKPKEPPAPVQMQPAPTPGSGQGPFLQLTVVPLRHARAADVAATLSALYGAAGADLGGGRPGTLSDELRRNVMPPVGTPPPAPVAPGAVTRSAVLEGAVTIVPDPFTNALLIRASEHDAALLTQAVAALDLRPLQVVIEVVIVEAQRDEQAAWGLGLDLPATPIHGGGGATVEGTQIGGGLSDFVIKVLNLGHAQLNAVLQAGASNGRVQILSRPVLLAANNHDARIMVGSQRPFVQVSRTLATDNTARDQVVEYKDVGTRLNVRPTISADGYVTLEVTQEVSNATSETQFGAPVISTREASTQVTVHDGQTIVLGGLLDRQNDRNTGGVPFLSDLPVVGGLFGRQSHHLTETELFLFLTPRVLRTDAEADSVTQRYQGPER
jgi:general secretion pathway protein D